MILYNAIKEQVWGVSSPLRYLSWLIPSKVGWSGPKIMIWKRLKYVIYVFFFSLYDTLFNIDLSFLRFASQLAWKTRIKYCILFHKHKQLRLSNNGIEHKPRQADDPFLIQRDNIRLDNAIINTFRCFVCLQSLRVCWRCIWYLDSY